MNCIVIVVVPRAILQQGIAQTRGKKMVSIPKSSSFSTFIDDGKEQPLVSTKMTLDTFIFH